MEGKDSFVMELPYKKHPPNVTVAGISTEVDAYGYATDQVLVAIPEACYTKHKKKITVSKEFEDRQPGGPTGMCCLYISDLEGGYETDDLGLKGKLPKTKIEDALQTTTAAVSGHSTALVVLSTSHTATLPRTSTSWQMETRGGRAADSLAVSFSMLWTTMQT